MSRIFGPHDPPAPAVPRRYPVTFRLTVDGQPVTTGATLRTDGPVPHEAFVGETGAIRFADFLPGGYNVTIQADGYEVAWQPLVITDGQQESDFTIALTRRSVAAPPVTDAGERGRLRAVGTRFLRDDGSLFPWRGCSDFSLFHRFLRGEDLDPILNTRIALGANLLRVFGQYNAAGIGAANGLGALRPSDYTPAQVTAFLAAVGARGLQVEWVLLADYEGSAADARTLISQYAQPLAAWNVLVELANEPFKNLTFPVTTLTTPPTWLVASGDYDDAVQTRRDYVTYHTDRKPEWPRTPRSLAELRDDIGGGTHTPVVADEPTGAAEVARGDSRSATPADFAYFAATAALMGAGATFHSEDGIASRPLGPVQRACAEAFFAALRYIPVEAQFAPYVRGGANNQPVGDLPVVHYDLEEGREPGALRTYSKEVGGYAYYVRIRPTGATVARPGWILDEEPLGILGIGRSRRA